MIMGKNEKYISPECEEITIQMEGCIAMSGENEGDGGDME